MEWFERLRRSGGGSGRIVLGLVLGAGMLGGAWAAPQGQPSSDEIIRRAFERLDADKNGRLSSEEYLAGAGPARVRARDFRLFDFNADGALTWGEFAAIPGLVPAADRGPIPDPYSDLVDLSVVAMDEAYGQWDQRPEFQVPTYNFVENFTKSIASDGKPRLSSDMLREADGDQNGHVTRAEARRFLEIQLGLRRSKGDILRELNGRVVNYALYLGIDVNKNDRLERAEVLEGWPDKARAGEIFDKADADRNGWLSFDEFCRNTTSGMNDPVEQFRKMDTNLDGTLDAAELAAGTPAWQKPLDQSVLPGFDSDGNGRISLAEYQMTMQANMILPWQRKLSDTSRDRLLSFEEFSFGQEQFSLLRRVMFTRLDRNGDDSLSPNEYPFQRLQPDALFALNADGTGWRKITDSEEYPNCGSPAVSPDGQWVAFDGYPAVGSYSASRLFVVGLDGMNRREIGPGLMPTWSPDGKKLACSRYGEGNTVWIVNLDGSVDRRIGAGWGAQWSPDGKTIAFTRQASLILYDVAAETETELLKAQDFGYSYIYYNMAWSPDNRRLAFKALKDNNKGELVSVAATGQDRDLQVHYAGLRTFDHDPSWSLDGQRLLVGMQSLEHKRTLLYEIDVGTKADPRLLEGQDLTVAAATNACWTPDGRRLVVRARPQ